MHQAINAVFLLKNASLLTRCAAISLLVSISTASSISAASAKLWQSYTGINGPGSGRHIVLISGDEEYRSEQALSALGQILAIHHGFRTTVLYSQNPTAAGIINPNYQKNIPGLKALRDADLMIIATRFRQLPDEQMQELENYLKSGSAVIGLRTATHAFKFPPQSPWAHWSFDYQGNRRAWRGGFGQLVLGTSWINHHGWHNHESTRGVAASAHDILKGIRPGDIWGPTDVYTTPLSLPGDSQVVAYGQVLAGMDRDAGPIGPGPYKYTPEYGKKNPNFDKNDPLMPLAWTKSYQLPGGKPGRAFVTTMGAATDLVAEGTRRMIVNAVYWCLDWDIPTAGTAVDLVQEFNPSQFGFKTDKFWLKKNMQVSDFDIK